MAANARASACAVDLSGDSDGELNSRNAVGSCITGPAHTGNVQLRGGAVASCSNPPPPHGNMQPEGGAVAVGSNPVPPQKQGCGVRRASGVWRVAVQPKGKNASRLTVPIDFFNGDVAYAAFQYLLLRLNELVPSYLDFVLFRTWFNQTLLLPEHVAGLETFAVAVACGTFTKSRGPPSTSPEVRFRGVVFDKSNWRACVRVQDVNGYVKSYKTPFVYPTAKEAGEAYDFATVYFCNLVGQRVKHKLNFDGGLADPDSRCLIMTWFRGHNHSDVV